MRPEIITGGNGKRAAASAKLNSKKHRHRVRWHWSHADKWREQRADQLHAARKTRSNRTRRENLRWRLENKVLRPALNSVLCSMLRQHRDDPAYDLVDAFIDILVTLRPDCDAGCEARWIGSKAGVPLDRLQTREELLAWFEERPTKSSSQPSGGQLAEAGCVGTPATTGQPGRDSHVIKQEEAL